MRAKSSFAYWAALALALVSAAAFVAVKHHESNPTSASSIGQRANTQSQALPDNTPTRIAPHIDRGSATPIVDAEKVFDQYKCRQGPEECKLDPLVASSAAEALWLQNNGYPTRRQIEESQNLSATQLKQRAIQSGSLADRALYAEKLANEGSTREALGLLGDVVTRGGTYGLYSISAVYASSNSDLFNPKLSRAYLRAAYLSGDSKATGTMVNRFPQFDTPAENYVVDKRASEIHRSFLSGRSTPRP